MSLGWIIFRGMLWFPRKQLAQQVKQAKGLTWVFGPLGSGKSSLLHEYPEVSLNHPKHPSSTHLPVVVRDFHQWEKVDLLRRWKTPVLVETHQVTPFLAAYKPESDGLIQVFQVSPQEAEAANLTDWQMDLFNLSQGHLDHFQKLLQVRDQEQASHQLCLQRAEGGGAELPDDSEGHFRFRVHQLLDEDVLTESRTELEAQLMSFLETRGILQFRAQLLLLHYQLTLLESLRVFLKNAHQIS